MYRSVLGVVLGLQFIAGAYGQTWCGKPYMQNQTASAPGGNFAIPSYSSSPLLAFRCAPAIRPYLEEDVGSGGGILIDTPVVNYQIAGAEPISLPSSGSLSSAGSLDVTVSVNGTTLGTAKVPLNATAYEIPISLKSFTPQMAAYSVSCSATYSGSSGSQTYNAAAALSVLPNPSNSSVTKMDLRTGALLAKPANGTGGDYAPVFPIGFYTTYDPYLTSNLSVLNELKEQGYVHPVPTFDNTTQLDEVLDRMQEVGLYLMYDMRFTYMNASSVTEQVNMIKSRPNLLLWYTGDEPDGTSDPLNATVSAYDLIYSLDGYHPVSLVLNCQDYNWVNYTAGTDVVMQDVYMVSNNVTFSSEWNTVCTADYGCCGCDNCQSIPQGDVGGLYPDNSTLWDMYAQGVPANSGVGTFGAISDRVQSFQNRLEVMGWERTKAMWTVPQAFGGDGEYWPRAPTGEEWIVQSFLGMNRGALGVVPWNDPTPSDIKSSASMLALALPILTPFLFSGNATRSNYFVNGVDVATWTMGSDTLVIAANTQYTNGSVQWSDINASGSGLQSALSSGSVGIDGQGFTLGGVGAVALVPGDRLEQGGAKGAAVPLGVARSAWGAALFGGVAGLVLTVL
ncbi:hypothetical protein CONPUDRAFT_93585 [Coniophora puteana RWD-64-598 SS2]|uniref:Glycoside hydrolase family 2 protein n=1 Tax=Coniophora puteana (strain RWD-64-598) TaxID=741705 RepID=A0A5M3M5T8_CONPW|nr:uncharacterized protein CONPUDRAFT_93585 [Coniophora puteana RWD-64-598 SS2]EIW74742.1 hypothetical protein CONPUDRAFT_93585 [Coniophora puteana RWD-64-598 SS2]